MPDMPRPRSPRLYLTAEIRRNDDGTLDEIVCCRAFVHLEQMDNGHWWMSIDDGKREIHVNLHSKSRIKAEVFYND